MANVSGQGPRRLGTVYSAIIGVIGAITSVLTLVQLLAKENALLITLVLTAVLGLAVIAIHFTWHQPDIRVRCLGTLTVAVLVLASLGGGYGLGRANASQATPAGAVQTPTPTPAGAGTSATVPTTGGGTTGAPATTPPAGSQALARLTPGSTELRSSERWENASASVEGVQYDEAIVVTMLECRTDIKRHAEYVLGRKYKRLVGKVALADDSELTTPVPFFIYLDGASQGRKTVTATPLELNLDLTNVNRVRFELIPASDRCDKSAKVAFVGVVAQP